MKNEIFKNLSFLSLDDLNEMFSLIDSNVDVKEYLLDCYSNIYNEWKSKYPMFDIPSGVISISVDGDNNYINFGNKVYDENTIFDIASITKLYTEMILFDVIDNTSLTLETKIGDITSNYSKISYLTLLDLISFNNTFYTEIDARECTNKKDCLNALRTSYIDKELSGFYKYTDLPIMILTDLLECYTNKSYKELFEEYIVKKYNLTNTYLELDDTSNYVSINGKYVNDPKANIMGGYYGHAGVKTSSRDFIKFMNNVLLDERRIKLFTDLSKTIDADSKDKPSYSKGIIGNSSINVLAQRIYDYPFNFIATCNLSRLGFAVQGSTRSHAETCIFDINGVKHIVTISLFMDIYTQYDNLYNYDKTKIREYYVDDVGKLYMLDTRCVLTYGNEYKDFLNKIGIARVISLYNKLKK